MKKVVIIGCPGSGKSTFARKLAEKTNLPLFYLDMIWHKSDRTVVSFEEFDKQLDKILSQDKWIIDGNYLRTLPRRLYHCDTVFFFDLPVEKCLAGAINRLGKDRPDMPWTDNKLDPEFRQWILDFPKKQLPIVNLFLDSFDKNIIRFLSRIEADEFINTLPNFYT